MVLKSPEGERVIPYAAAVGVQIIDPVVLAAEANTELFHDMGGRNPSELHNYYSYIAQLEERTYRERIHPTMVFWPSEDLMNVISIIIDR